MLRGRPDAVRRAVHLHDGGDAGRGQITKIEAWIGRAIGRRALDDAKEGELLGPKSNLHAPFDHSVGDVATRAQDQAVARLCGVTNQRNAG